MCNFSLVCNFSLLIQIVQSCFKFIHLMFNFSFKTQGLQDAGGGWECNSSWDLGGGWIEQQLESGWGSGVEQQLESGGAVEWSKTVYSTKPFP